MRLNRIKKILSFVLVEMILLLPASSGKAEYVSAKNMDLSENLLSPRLTMDMNFLPSAFTRELQVGNFENLTPVWSDKELQLARDKEFAVSQKEYENEIDDMTEILNGHPAPRRIARQIIHFIKNFDAEIIKIEEQLKNSDLKRDKRKHLLSIVKSLKKRIKEKNALFEPSPVVSINISGPGGSGKSTAALKNLKEGNYFILEFDHYILEKSDRPIDPDTGNTSEKLPDKFEVEEFNRSMHAFADGRIIFKPIFDSTTRGRLKVMLDNQGNLVIYNGKKELGLVLSAEKDGKPELREAEDSEGFSSVKCGKYTFSVDKVKISDNRGKSKTMPLLSLENTDYIIDKQRIGVDVFSLCSRESASKSEIALAHDQKNAEPGQDKGYEETVYFSFDKDGQPVFEYQGQSVSSAMLRTLKLDVKDNEDPNYIDCLVNDNRFKISRKKWSQIALKTDIAWFDLSENKQKDLKQRVVPDSDPIIIEGVGATSDKRLNELSIVWIIDADIDVRFNRMLKRSQRESRGITENEFVKKRVDLIRVEEWPYVWKWIKTDEHSPFQFRTMSHSLAEAVFLNFRDGRLYEQKYQPVMEKLELKAEEIKDILSSMAVKRMISRIEVDHPFTSDSSASVGRGNPAAAYFIEHYVRGRSEYGFVVAEPRDEIHFKEDFLPVFNELQKRLGGMVIESFVVDLTKKHISNIILDSGYAGARKLQHVLVKSSVLESLDSRVRFLLKEWDQSKENSSERKKIKEHLRMLFIKFRNIQMELGRRGVVDSNPDLKKYAFKLLVDEKYGERVLLNLPVECDVDTMVNYRLENYALSNISDLPFPAELEHLYETEVLDKMPSSEDFRKEYFGQARDHWKTVADPFDIGVIVDQIKKIRNEIRPVLRDMAYLHHMEALGRLNATYGENIFSEEEALFIWLRMYSVFLKEIPSGITLVAEKLYDVLNELKGSEEFERFKLIVRETRLSDFKKFLSEKVSLADEILSDEEMHTLFAEVRYGLYNRVKIKEIPQDTKRKKLRAYYSDIKRKLRPQEALELVFRLLSINIAKRQKGLNLFLKALKDHMKRLDKDRQSQLLDILIRENQNEFKMFIKAWFFGLSIDDANMNILFEAMSSLEMIKDLETIMVSDLLYEHSEVFSGSAIDQSI